MRIRLHQPDTSGNIYVDELFESMVTSFLLTSFLWSEFQENEKIWGFAFSNMLYIFHEQCILGEMISEIALEEMLRIVSKMDSHLFTLVTDCYWLILEFTMFHELAYIYFRKCGRISTIDRQIRKEEYDADRIAYDMVLWLIMRDAKKPEKERTFYEHSYLAPMMLMEHFDLFYYIERVLYKQWVDDWTHPAPMRRKNQFFGIVDRPEYQFNTEEGNVLYQGLLDVMDKYYKLKLLIKMEKEKLAPVLDRKRRTERIYEGS